jgi:hypothetical protein
MCTSAEVFYQLPFAMRPAAGQKHNLIQIFQPTGLFATKEQDHPCVSESSTRSGLLVK